MRKGQGKYIIGIFVMIAAIAIGMMGQFATKYVLSQAFVNMNENFARYESLTHSYMIVNNDVNNVGNHTEMSAYLTDNPRCHFTSSDIVVDEGERYRIAFTDLEGSFGGGDCSYLPDHYFEEPDFNSPNLFSAPFISVYPKLAFWSPAENEARGKSFYIHTRVEPERDY